MFAYRIQCFNITHKYLLNISVIGLNFHLLNVSLTNWMVLEYLSLLTLIFELSIILFTKSNLFFYFPVKDTIFRKERLNSIQIELFEIKYLLKLHYYC